MIYATNIIGTKDDDDDNIRGSEGRELDLEKTIKWNEIMEMKLGESMDISLPLFILFM
jgi:hypothetical protein